MELAGANSDRQRHIRSRYNHVVLLGDRVMMAAWVGQPLTDTGWRLRPPGWVSSKISSTPAPPIRLHPADVNPRLTCSPTLTAHGAGSTGLYRELVARNGRAAKPCTAHRSRPGQASLPAGRSGELAASGRSASRRDTATVGIRFGAGRSRRCGAAGAARRRKPSGQRDRADRTFTAQRLDNWRRLKLCRNDRCAVSFSDRSRNNSAVYHDSRECGNAIYLRASRARKRQGALNTNEYPIDAEKP